MIGFDEIENNINVCKLKVENALKRANRHDKVTIIGATKTQPHELIEFINNKKLLDVVGENHVQEIVAKYDYAPNLSWHMIGQLQSNKVKYIVDKVDLIHSLDRESLAQEINKQALKVNKTIDCLVEINMGSEISKGGIEKDLIDDFMSMVQKYPQIKIKGLMSVMPNLEDRERLKDLYYSLNEKFNYVKKYSNEINTLSCGMTNDYEMAIEFGGSNMIRLGRVLFGARV